MAAIYSFRPFRFRPNGRGPSFQVIAEDWDEAANKVAASMSVFYEKVWFDRQNGFTTVITQKEGKTIVWIPKLEKD